MNTNYRSRKQIVDFYGRFINQINWQKDENPAEHYRVIDKDINAHGKDADVAVLTTQSNGEDMPTEVAALVRKLIDTGKVKDPNQIAFLYYSLNVKGVEPMIAALEAQGLKVYAPRARNFLEVPESIEMFGLFTLVFGKPEQGNFGGYEFKGFHKWLNEAHQTAVELVKNDYLLQEFIADKRNEITTCISDYTKLLQTIKKLDFG